MANANIPVPTDLAFVRTGPESGYIDFTSVGDTLLYDVRLALTPEFWGEAWSAMIGPYPTGTFVRVPVDVPTQLIITEVGTPVPPPPSGEAYIFIVAQDPALAEWSYIYPPPEGVPLVDGGNWGQGGLRVIWGEWIEPTPINEPPVASFRAITTGLSASFTNMSTDPEGDIVSYSWNFGDDNTSVTINPTHVYVTGGNYQVSLTVTDTAGNFHTVTGTVSVETPVPVNELPTASYRAITNGLSVVFENTSTDPEGNIVVYSWEFGDGTVSDIPSPIHIYTAEGTYQVSLTIIDGAGNVVRAIGSISVTVPKNKPSASFIVTRSFNSVSFVDNSSDIDGTIVSWDWNFGDGFTSVTQNPTHVYESAGNYTAVLTVTDNQGLTSTAQGIISISLSPDIIEPQPVIKNPLTSVGILNGDEELVLVTYADGSTAEVRRFSIWLGFRDSNWLPKISFWISKKTS